MGLYDLSLGGGSGGGFEEEHMPVSELVTVLCRCRRWSVGCPVRGGDGGSDPGLRGRGTN